MSRPRELAAVRTGGGALVLASILFIAVFGYLAATFDYPDVLDQPAADVFPRLLALGTTGRAVWSLYALIPLLLVPAGVGASIALRGSAAGAARSAAAFAIIAAFSMMLGLLRWPSIHWELARVHATASTADRLTIEAMFAGLNSYLGNFIGEFVGELALNLFFLLTAYAILRSSRHPRWLGIGGVIASAIGLGAMFRNVTHAMAPVADANNLVLPVWLIVLGVAFLRERPHES